MKKLLALILSCLMVMSLCVVSVSAERVFNNGNTILSDDFEDYTIAEEGKQLTDRGTYGYYYLQLWDYNGDQVWTSKIGGGGIEWQNKLAGAAAVESGQLAISYTVTVPSNYEGGLSGSAYPSVYHGHWYDSSYDPIFVVANMVGNGVESRGGVMLTGGFNIGAANVAAGEVYTFSADEPHEIKIVADYDNKTTTLYVDDNPAGSIERVPKFISGGNSYITFKPQNHTSYSVDGNGAYPEIIVHGWKIEKLVVERKDSFSYTTYDGTTDRVAKTIPAGTNKISIDFGVNVNRADLNEENIIVSGNLGNGSCQISPDFSNKRTAIVEFDDCLMPGESYSIEIGDGIIDATGEPIKPQTVTFTADAGEVKYHVPAISVDAAADVTLGSDITVEALVANTAKVPQSAYVIIAAYKDGALTGLERVAYSYNNAADPCVQTVSKTFAATEGFVGADELKAWYISDIVNIKPLADPVVIQ